ncbi:MAG: hypothetical protein H8D72_00365 [Planctomycetes bacterium]|nr:hypothetical protein [Planctomycetota bacterium]
MDFDEYWQENKRFVGLVFAALVVFLIARGVVSSTLGGDVQAAARALSNAEGKLKAPMYDTRDRDAARKENEALKAVVAQLSEAVAFVPREGFDLVDVRSASSRYHGTLARVREELLPLAGRANMALDGDLGQPALSPTRSEEIGRYLEGLDLVDRVVRLAIDTRVSGVESLKVTLDSGLRSKEGVGEIERTRVSATLVGSGASLLEFLRRARRPELVPGGQPLVIEELDMRAAKRGVGAELEVRFNVVRLAPLTSDASDEEEGR